MNDTLIYTHVDQVFLKDINPNNIELIRSGAGWSISLNCTNSKKLSTYKTTFNKAIIDKLSENCKPTLYDNKENYSEQLSSLVLAFPEDQKEIAERAMTAFKFLIESYGGKPDSF